MKFSLISALLIGFTGVAHAGIYPSTPVGETVWKVGSKVNIAWSDNDQLPPLSKIEPFEVALYSGSDMQQIKLAVIASNVTGTTTSLNYVVPDVTPYGKIYFLRFTAPNVSKPEEPYLFWSTRFTISNTDSTQPSPSNVGTGQLAVPTSSAHSSNSAGNTTSSALIESPTSSANSPNQPSSASLSTSMATLSSVIPPISSPPVAKVSASQATSEPQDTIAAIRRNGASGLATSNPYWIILPIIGFLTFY